MTIFKKGVNCRFHNLTARWRGADLELVRDGETVLELRSVESLEEEYAEVPESEQHVVFMRAAGSGYSRAFFIDADPVQTNVREVSAELERLSDVLDWLLRPGYVYRQGDVALYLIDSIPPNAVRVPAAEYAARFVSVLSNRHTFEPREECGFFTQGEQYFVAIDTDSVELLHPEHVSISICPGRYEVAGACGTPLPEIIGLRPGEAHRLDG